MNSTLNNISKDEQKIFLMLAPDYANVGDIAISIAQQKILQEIHPSRKIIEIPMLNFYEYKNDIKNIINNDDIITIIGGGNMGSVYLEGEERRRDIIKSFPNNKIISFPQSINFENTLNGKEEFEKTIKTYGEHKNLTIFAREERSYNIMKQNFKNDVYLVPDTVFYLKDKFNIQENTQRKFITLCLRDDKEKMTSNTISKDIISLLKNNNLNNIKSIDTYLGNIKFEPSDKNSIFEKLLKEFTESKVIITDRLHGMIFALITHTPCIALDNSNKKVSSTYNTWLKECSYIRFLDKFSEADLLKYIQELLNLEKYEFNFCTVQKFETLFKKLK